MFHTQIKDDLYLHLRSFTSSHGTAILLLVVIVSSESYLDYFQLKSIFALPVTVENRGCGITERGFLMKRLLSAILIVGCLSACACSKKEESKASISSDSEVTVESTDAGTDASSSETERTANEDGNIPLFNGTEEDALNCWYNEDFFTVFPHGEKETISGSDGNQYEAYRYTAIDTIILNPEPSEGGSEAKEIQLYYGVREDGAIVTIFVFDEEHNYPLPCTKPLYYNPEKKCLVVNWCGWNQDFYCMPNFCISADRVAARKHDEETMFGSLESQNET